MLGKKLGMSTIKLSVFDERDRTTGPRIITIQTIDKTMVKSGDGVRSVVRNLELEIGHFMLLLYETHSQQLDPTIPLIFCYD